MLERVLVLLNPINRIDPFGSWSQLGWQRLDCVVIVGKRMYLRMENKKCGKTNKILTTAEYLVGVTDHGGQQECQPACHSAPCIASSPRRLARRIHPDILWTNIGPMKA